MSKRFKLLLLAFVVFAFGQITWAETITLTSSSGEVELHNGDVLTGTGGANTHVTVVDGATVTLNNVTNTSINNNNWFPGLTCLGDAIIILEGDNALKGTNRGLPGLTVAEGKTLTIRGNGTLTASSAGSAAGIGAGSGTGCGNIVIESGTIYATGGRGSAGIGAGYSRYCENITILGGTITATGGNWASGIGAGEQSSASCGNIQITGGTITAIGGVCSAGIGGGESGNCGNITITNGINILVATSPEGYNCIGSGRLSSCGTITIHPSLQEVTEGNTLILSELINQDAQGNYLISSLQDYLKFATIVNGGVTNANARMTADIDLGDDQTMISTENKKYSGTFDGQGHTLTINYISTEISCAPFLYIENATIKNIHVTGTINTSHRRAAGLVANSYGTSYISNSWSSVALISTYNGDAERGGFVSCVQNGTLTIDDSYFDGTLTGEASYTWGGFVGWNKSTSIINNCLFNPISVNINPKDSETFSSHGGTITNCHYTVRIGSSTQGTQIPDGQLADGSIAFKLQQNRADLIWGQRIGIDPAPVLTSDETYRVYRSINGGYTNDPALAYIYTQDAEGYYLLGNKRDWQEFAFLVEIIPNANARMTADIDLEDTQVMIGDGYYANANYRHPFMGIFDGQGHTLTVNLSTASIHEQWINAGLEGPRYHGIAPFGYVWNGTIRNLHTAGTITSVHDGTAGIVGWTNGTVLIENCHSSVNITYTNGAEGMAGITYNNYNDNHNLTIRDCIYDGTLTASDNNNSKKNSAGFVVYRSYGNVYIINSLLAATFANGLGTSGCATFVRNNFGNGYISNSHYQTALGTVQGIQAPAEQLTNGRTTFYLQNGRTELVWGQEIGVDLLPVLTNDESKRVYRSATGYTNNPAEAIDDQGLQPFAYTINNNGEITITGFDACFTPPANYELVIPDAIDGYPVVYIANDAFKNKTNFTSLSIGQNVKSIGQTAFNNCTAMTNVSMPTNGALESIGTNAFNGCTNLTSFDMPNTVTSIGTNILYGCTNLTSVTISNQLTVIQNETFRNCTHLNNIVIPSSVTTINNNAFLDCDALTSITIPNSVTTMGTSVFQSCGLLATVTFEDGCQLTSIPNNTFYQCSVLNNFTIPTSITSIGSAAFRYCNGLTAINIPSSVTTISGYAFADCPAMTNATMANGINITTLPDHLFYNDTHLASFTIPASVTTINEAAFQNCTALTNMVVPNTVTTLNNYVFYGCTNLETVTLPNQITTLSTELFRNCTHLNNVVIPSSVTTINNNVFLDCDALTSIAIPNSVTTMGTSVFQSCDLLAEVTFEDGCQLTSIPNNTFYQCGSLPSITIPTTVKTIGNSAFRYCTSLNNVVLHSGLTSIQDWSFANCTGLENLTIEEGVPNINRDVFQYSGLKNVVLPSTVGTIGINLFYQCNQLETLDVSKCVNVWELYNYNTLRGSNTIFYGVPTSTKIILPPYAHATLGANDEIATLAFDLTADSDGYYLINNASDWDKFVVYSRANPTINGRITADIDLTNHAGKLGVGSNESNYITYQGTFDGQGHTMTIQYRTSQDVEGGLFAYVENATIQNLKVSGNIIANHRLVGGFVGFVKPSSTLTMLDCESDVNFTVTTSSTNMHIAGFIGQGKTSTITLTDCVYSGTITAVSSFRYAAGFLGWKENPGTITYTYCLNNGTFSHTENGYTYALGATANNGQSTANNCYYKKGNVTNNENLAQVVSTEELESGYVTFHLQANRLEQHWGQLLGTDPLPRLTDEEGTRVYRGQTYTNEPTSYTGLQQDDDGYYLIGGTADWEEFCQVVLEFPASNARMTANVVVADNSMVGASDKKYSGIFDGQGHTLTVNYEPNGTHCAPFRYIDGATIQNLRVAGTIHTPYRFAGGLVAMSFGTSNIERCWSSVELVSTYNGDAVYSGFVACLGGGTLNINDCLFDGILTGSLAYTWGGFVGWRYNYTVNISHCLFVPNSVNVGTPYSATFSGNGGTVTDSYYSICLNNSTQGTQASEAQLESGEIAYLLQDDNADLVWGQLLGTDATPIVTTDESRRVYDKGYNEYTNNPAEVCEIPLNFKCTSRSATTAFLEWTATDAESYEIYLTTDASDMPGKYSTTDIVSNTNSKLFTGLTAETTYYAYVRGNCGNEVGKGAWSNRCKFLPSVTQYVTANEVGTVVVNGCIPFVASYAEDARTRGQFIIPASELTDVVNGQITKMTFYGDDNCTYTGNFNVSLAEVEQTTLDDGFYSGSVTSVYQGTLTVEGDDHLMDVVFNNNFTYHGGNLLVNFSVGKGGNFNYRGWYGITTTSNTGRHRFYDGCYMEGSDQFLPTTTITFLPEDVDQNVIGYGESTVSDHWVFIASPVKNYLAPVDVTGLIAAEEEDYDLYRFNQSGENGEWENYKAHTEGFVLENGKGYLYANKNSADLTFAGVLNMSASMEVALDYDENARLAGYNLVGNPFTEAAYIDRTYFKMNNDGDDVVPVENYNEEAIPALTGVVVVAASDNEKVTFSKATPVSSTGNKGSLQMTLTKAGTRGNVFQDKAIVSFNENAQLGKFVFNKDHAKLYLMEKGEGFAISHADKHGEAPLYFTTRENGDFTLTVNPENVKMNYLRLIDNISGADIDLLATPSYTFSARNDDYASRFKLVFSANENGNQNEDFAFISNGEIIINGEGTVQMIDMLGRTIVTRRDGSTVSTEAMVPGVYVLRLINGQNAKTQKIVIR